MSSVEGKTALIFGASGISGWAVLRSASVYPSPSTFKRMIGLTHRHLPEKEAALPPDPRIELYSGINLSAGNNKAIHALKHVPHVDEVTHVYFCAYTGHGSDYQELKRQNVALLEAALAACEELCPRMVFFTLQSGGKAYGIEFTEHVKIPVPTPESTPRIPEPYASNIFYYAQLDLLKKRSVGKQWRFCDVRPDVIVGFVPHGNAMNIALALALWLSLYRSVEGQGAEIAFPGDEKAWQTTRTDTSQDILARCHLFASMHPDKVAGRTFNVADGQVVTWAQVWPGICQYFDLKGVGPRADSMNGVEYMDKHQQEWQHFEDKHQLQVGSMPASSFTFAEGIMGSAKVNREYDLSAARGVGFEEAVPTVASYHIAFDRYRRQKIIP